MRDYLRRTCDDIWVIDCSPEGHQPEVNTRIFQGVQQPVCIVMASRSAKSSPDTPATVLFHALPRDRRQEKFHALNALRLDSKAWTKCPAEWRAPFLPASVGAWATYPKLEDLFVYNGSGVMPGRTWIIAPDAESLESRWQALVHAPSDKKEILFHPHLVDGGLGDRHNKRIVQEGLPGYEGPGKSVDEENGSCIAPVRYGFRSFDRQWIIPDNRVINRPNPQLWRSRSNKQIYIAAPSDRSPTGGPALTVSGSIPDLHYYNGRGGRAFPLWSDQKATVANVPPQLPAFLKAKYGMGINTEDVFCYILATAAHPAFTKRFQDDLSTPGLRIPLTADGRLFKEAVELGRTVIWLHTFGERMADEKNGRPAQPPRLPGKRAPRIPAGGEISQEPSIMPDTIDYDPEKQRLLIGPGYVEGVEASVWNYEVSGKQVLLQWFSYRKANRERPITPIIGDRRTPSPLGDIQPDYWLAEYTTELINLLNILGLLVDFEQVQAALLEKICSGPTISAEELTNAGALTVPVKAKKVKKKEGPDLFGEGA